MNDESNSAAPKQWNVQSIVPWVAIGISVVALVVAVMALDGQGKGASQTLTKTSKQSSPFALPLGSSFPAPKQSNDQAPDLSSMTPQEMADRLFNRVMTASENGNTKEALVFVPMAVEAYNNLGTLDNDARYHLALIHMVAGDIKNTKVQLAKLRQSAPKHLLGLMAEYQIASQSGNKDSAAQVYKSFLAAYDKEIAEVRAEYQDHRGSIERFRQAAQASMAGKK